MPKPQTIIPNERALWELELHGATRSVADQHVTEAMDPLMAALAGGGDDAG